MTKHANTNLGNCRQDDYDGKIPKVEDLRPAVKDALMTAYMRCAVRGQYRVCTAEFAEVVAENYRFDRQVVVLAFEE